MRKIYFTLLCCAAVLPAACVPGGGLRTGGPEKTFLGYRIIVPDNKESARSEAEQQAKAYCESENKKYEFSRLVTWSTVRLGRYVPSYNFYFICREPQVAESSEPEKLTPQKSEALAGKEEPPREEAVVSAGREVPGKTVMIVTPEPEVSEPSPDTPTIEARPSKIKITALSKERGRQVRQVRAASASSLWFTTKDKNYIPGEPEPLAPPGEEEHPSILGGQVFEESLDN